MPRQPLPQPIALSLSLSRSLFTSFTTFLTVAIHTLLRCRNLYPAPTFLLARAYNTPVYQSRHPALCAWITDAVAAVAAQLASEKVDRVVIAVHAGPGDEQEGGSDGESDWGEDRKASQGVQPGSVLERWVFDTSRMPAFPGGTDALHEKERSVLTEEERDKEGSDDDDIINWADVDEQYRGTLLRLTRTGEAMPPAKMGSTFTVAVELKDDGEAPIGHPQPWIPSNPKSPSPDLGLDAGAQRTHPVRAVRVGPMFFDCWMEESIRDQATRDRKGKGRATSPTRSHSATDSQQQSQAVPNASENSSS